MRSVLSGVLGLTALAGTAVADIGATANYVRTMPLGTPYFGTQAVAPGATYSNITNFAGSGYANGGAALIGTALTTKYVSEQINMTGAQPGVIRFDFSVANFGALPVSARARVRFHQLDNVGGTTTGTYITGFSFALISFPVGVSTYFASTAAFALPASFSMGITFDNLGSAATAADLNGLGVGIFNPPDVGTSPDLAFSTTAASVGNVSGAAGSTFNFGGAPVANFGWQIVPAPSAMALLGLGGLMAARRRR